VLLLGDLVAEALHSGAARMHGISAAVDSHRLGPPLAQELSAYLRTLEPAELGHVLMAGMTFAELPLPHNDSSLVRRLHHGADFVIDPLPNLLFTRDSSFWIGPRVVITSLALSARMRESSLTDLVYAHHPRFRGVRRAFESRSAPVEGATCCCWLPAWWRSEWGSGPPRRVRNRWCAAFSTISWRTPCWRWPSRAGANRCTWTPSAPWSTPMRW
jgi:arginine deiminase